MDFRYYFSSLHTLILSLSIIFFCIIPINDGVILPLPTSIGQSFEFDLQITVPYTIILPAFVGKRRRRRNSNLKSTEDEAEKEYWSYFNQLISQFDTTTKEGVVYSRLYSLFAWMGLDDIECQKRLLCLLSQDPNKYSPLSDIVFQHLDPRRDFVNIIEVEDVLVNRQRGVNWQYFEFYEAEKKGFFPGTNCTHETLLCKINPDESINWNVMRAFRSIKEFVNLSFK